MRKTVLGLALFAALAAPATADDTDPTFDLDVNTRNHIALLEELRAHNPEAGWCSRRPVSCSGAPATSPSMRTTRWHRST